MSLLLLSLALVWGWEALKSIAFFTIHPRISAFLIAGMAYAGTFLPGRVLLALGAAGAAGVIRMILQVRSLPPVDIPRPRKISVPPGARGKAPSTPQGVGHRIPRL